MVKVNIERVTQNEYSFIMRNRNGTSQKQAAEASGVSRNTFGRKERLLNDEVVNTDLTEVEICILLRKRFNLTQKELADRLGVTRFWVNQMEAGKATPTKLINYWGNTNAG